MKRCLMTKQRRLLSPEFKRNAASLVLDQSYRHLNACRSVGVAEPVLRRWVERLQLEREVLPPQSKAPTPGQTIHFLECRAPRLP